MENKSAPSVDLGAIASFCRRVAVQLNVSQDIADFIAISIYEIEKVKHASLSYLDLPDVLCPVFAGDPAYLAGLPAGRYQYRSEQDVWVPELQQVVRCPFPYDRQEILDFIDTSIRIPDPRVAAAIPLAYNVGFVVGWLSGLSIAQRDDAQAGLVVLATLVAPLLLCNVLARANTPKQKHKSLPAPSRKGSRSKQSRKR